MISINLQSNFIEIALWHGCSPANLLHIFRTYFPRNTSGWLLLSFIIVILVVQISLKQVELKILRKQKSIIDVLVSISSWDHFLGFTINLWSKEFEKWRAIRTSVGGVGGVLAWIAWVAWCIDGVLAWVACLRGWHGGRACVGGVLTWVTWLTC